VPEFAAWLPPSLATHTGQHRNFGSLAGAAVAVVGAGQSALEAAALLREAGATVEVIARGAIRWTTPSAPSWAAGHPLAMRSLPVSVRSAMGARWLRPGGAAWLRPRVVGVVRLTQGTTVMSAAESAGGVRLALSDGSRRRVDHLVLGTGYRPDVRGLPFLTRDLRDRIATAARLPRLNRWFESSVPRLHFVGPLAEHEFGPICRFLAGAAVAARQVSARASGGA
jgi:NADPH-dependent 2,4-dienoyl-CoA reductase/sulfur reductase-like enzyme